MKRLVIATALAAPLAVAPAWALDPGAAAGKAAHFSTPLQVSPGMPNPAGAFTLRLNGGFVGAAVTPASGLGADAFLGLTDQLGFNVRSTYTQVGPNLINGHWNDIRTELQWAVLQTDDKAAALSLVGAGIIPGGPGGANLAGIRPGVGLRGAATLGVLQTSGDALYRPNAGELDVGLAGVVQVARQLSASLDLVGTVPVGAGTTSLGLTPGILFQLTPGIRIGAGYVFPLQGTPPQSGQILAHLQFGM